MHVNKHFQPLLNALDGNFFKGSGEKASRLYPVVVILTLLLCVQLVSFMKCMFY